MSWSAQFLRRAGTFALLTGGGLFAQPMDSGAATARARSAPVFTAYFENDSFTGTDQHYTNGLKFSWLSADLVDWGQSGWRKTFVEFLPFVNRPEGQKNFGVAFGQNIYTPRDIAALTPDPADRPYAGWGYLELVFVSKTRRSPISSPFRPASLDRTAWPRIRSASFIDGPTVPGRGDGTISSATKPA